MFSKISGHFLGIPWLLGEVIDSSELQWWHGTAECALAISPRRADSGCLAALPRARSTASMETGCPTVVAKNDYR